jgi:hypothetical protein
VDRSPRLYGLPGYAFVLAAVYTLAGVHPGAVFLLQSIVESGTSAMMLIISKIILGSKRKNDFLSRKNLP